MRVEGVVSVTGIEQEHRPEGSAVGEQATRALALKQLKKRRDFAAHALIYVLVNAFIVVIWVMTSSGGFFWPIFPMIGWGIGLVMNAWDVWHGDTFSEEQIQREMRRMSGR